MMFDQVEAIRLALWNFVKDEDGNADPHCPAWDWQFVVREPQVSKWYGYRARMLCMTIAEPDDATYILKHCRHVDGFYGASSMERLPTERAIREQTQRFTEIRKA